MTVNPEALGMVRIQKPDGTIKWVKPEKKEKQTTEAQRLLEIGEGYLQSNQHEDLQGVVKGRWTISDDELQNIEQRIKLFERAGIPRIFTLEHCTPTRFLNEKGREYTRFPVPDQIINIFYSGQRNSLEEEAYTDPADLEKVLHFAEYAIRPEVASLVEEEIVQLLPTIYSSLKRRNMEGINRNVRAAFRELSEGLREVGRAPRLAHYQPESKPAEKIVKDRFWYSEYSTEDIERIVKDYWSSVEKELEKGASRSASKAIEESNIPSYHMIRELFPELSPSDQELDSVATYWTSRRTAENAIKTGDWSEVQARVYHESDDFRETIENAASDHIATAGFPLSVFARSKDQAIVGMGFTLSFGHEIGIDVDKAHADAVRKSTPDQVLSHLRSLMRSKYVHRPKAGEAIKEFLVGYLSDNYSEDMESGILLSTLSRRTGMHQGVLRPAYEQLFDDDL